MGSFKQQLQSIRSEYEQLADGYETFSQLLALSEPFVPTYAKPVSRQSSVGMKHFSSHRDS